MTSLRILLACLSCALCQSAQAKVIGEDEREVIGDAERGFASAVGIVHCEATLQDGEKVYQTTTGTIVETKELVLASAHAIRTTDTESGRPHVFDLVRDCFFAKLLNNGDRVQRRFLGGEFGRAAYQTGMFQDDWSVLRLDGPIEIAEPQTSRTFRIEHMTPDRRVPIEIIAHHVGVGSPKKLYHSRGMMRLVTKDGRQEVGHTADTTSRASGAAIIYKMSDGSMVIFGVHAGGIGGHALNRVMPINREIIEALNRAMRAGD